VTQFTKKLFLEEFTVNWALTPMKLPIVNVLLYVQNFHLSKSAYVN